MVGRGSSVVILVADGLRPDALDIAMARGEVPALAAIRDEGTLATATTVFPGVTGVAYIPFLMGRFPGGVGVPGLRWFDRTRRLSAMLGHSRSYTGFEGWFIDRDLDPGCPTLFELAPGPSLGLLSIVRRGLPASQRLDRGPRFTARAGWAHFRGDVRRGLALDRVHAERLVDRIARDRPRFVFAALMGIDKAQHMDGPSSPSAATALGVVDATVAAIRRDAERDGRWREMHLLVVSDHGHAPVVAHDDLADAVRSLGYRVRAHPWAMRPGRDVAVMVSGNAMAHVYLELDRAARPHWPALRARWSTLVAELLARPSMDLLIVPTSPTSAEVRARGRGSAVIEWRQGTYSYEPGDGDPLRTGGFRGCSAHEVLERSWDSDYPDAVVQIAALAGASRAGDVILSAAPGWDFRERYEPVAHRSTHGALHRDQMRVPLLVNRPSARRPLRTVDVMPSALRALGVAVPPGLDGRSFL